VICDTGSDDGTPEFIQAYFKKKGIPGKLVSEEWVNFGYNRSELLKKAKGCADYLLLMDADFIFKVGDNINFKQTLNNDAYYIKYEGGVDYQQVLLVNGVYDWVYKGVTHEYITSDKQKFTPVKTNVFRFLHKIDGSNRVDKIERDIRLLKQGLIDEPDNSRYHFYLAQSYTANGNYQLAKEHFKLRIGFGGWQEEVYYSKLQIGLTHILENNKNNENNIHDGLLIIDILLEAFDSRKTRLEALYYAVKLCRLQEKYTLGFTLGYPHVDLNYPVEDVLFISKEIHKYEFLNELAICCFFSNHYKEALYINEKIINENRASGDSLKNIKNNVEVCRQKINGDENANSGIVQKRINEVNTTYNNNLYESVVLNAELLNNTTQYNRGLFVNIDVKSDNLEEVMENVKNIMETDDKLTNSILIIIHSVENFEQSEYLDVYFKNKKYPVFRAKIKTENAKYGVACGIGTLNDLKCKTNFYINSTVNEVKSILNIENFCKLIDNDEMLCFLKNKKI
jgi:hypothetical protein